MTEIENNVQIAVFGAGCFWCTEAVFKGLRGVISVVPGYTGGHVDNPTYYEVCSESTGHAEAIKIEFDPAVISYDKLVEVFFKTHDPTTLNRQGPDEGTRYRSVIFYIGNEQKDQSENFVGELKSSGIDIVTEVVAFNKFYEAEEEHKDFYKKNPNMMYCQIVIQPKMEKVQGQFSELLKN